LRLIALLVSGVGSDLLLQIACSVCLFLPLPGCFSTQNSFQSGEFYVEKSHLLDG
jgi:hypothetical protein